MHPAREDEHLLEGVRELSSRLCGLFHLDTPCLACEHDEGLLEEGALAVGARDVLPEVLGRDAKVLQLAAGTDQGKVVTIHEVTSLGRGLEHDDPRLRELSHEGDRDAQELGYAVYRM